MNLSVTFVLFCVSLATATPTRRSILPNACGRTVSSRIVGGVASRAHTWPWAAKMTIFEKVVCGGALVTSQHVVTAAHCVVHYLEVQHLLQFVLGSHNTTDGEIYEVERINVHPDHRKRARFDSDIAIVTLASPVSFNSKISPVCLPASGLSDAGLAYVVGWGLMKEKGSSSTVLQEAEILPSSACSNYSTNFTSNMICAGHPEGLQDACQGDSGGPMVVEAPSGTWQLVGVVSFGRGCGRVGFPGVYTRVELFVNWISEFVDKNM